MALLKLRGVRFDLDDDIYRTGEPATQRGFEPLGNGMSGGNIKLGVHDYMQIDKDFSANGAGPQMMPIVYLVFGLD